VEWVAKLDPRPRRVFLVHGEPVPATTLAGVIHDRLGIETSVPEKGETVELWP